MGFFKALGGGRRGTFLLGGLLTGGAGAALITTALQRIARRSRDKRLAEERSSKPVSPDEVEAALGEERIRWLIRQTGLTRDELMAGLRFSTDVKPERFRRYS